MLNELEKIVLNSIDTIIKNTTSDKKLQKIHKAHEVKLHFIPIKYRVFGGIYDCINHWKNLTRELIIIGGASIYEQFLPHATHMVLTKIDHGIAYECDTFFPDFDDSEWIYTKTKAIDDLVWIDYLERK